MFNNTETTLEKNRSKQEDDFVGETEIRKYTLHKYQLAKNKVFSLLDGEEEPSKDQLEDLVQWILMHSHLFACQTKSVSTLNSASNIDSVRINGQQGHRLPCSGEVQL